MFEAGREAQAMDRQFPAGRRAEFEVALEQDGVEELAATVARARARQAAEGLRRAISTVRKSGECSISTRRSRGSTGAAPSG